MFLISLFTALTPLNYDFGADSDYNWYVVSDGVMGGQSFGELETTKNSLKFNGEVSLANNGGFSSIRSPYQSKDLSVFSEVTIRYKSTGRNFSFQLQRYEPWYLPNYKVLLENTQGTWKELVVNVMEFKEYRVGRYTGSSISSEDLSRIIRMGLITEEKKEGPFEIEVDYIKFR